jgi:hypothetical protein
MSFAGRRAEKSDTTPLSTGIAALTRAIAEHIWSSDGLVMHFILRHM